MVNEIDGYKAPTESQSSRPLPACWMVKEIARYVAGKCSLASNLIHHRASSKGSAARGAQVQLASNLVHHRASSMGSGEPWPSRPNVNKTGMNQNSRQWLLFISLRVGWVKQ